MDDGRLVLGETRQAGQQVADPVLLKNLVDMGFPEVDSRVALERTSNRNLEVQQPINKNQKRIRAWRLLFLFEFVCLRAALFSRCRWQSKHVLAPGVLDPTIFLSSLSLLTARDRFHHE